MEISADKIYDFVYELLTTSKNADFLTMRIILDEFKKKYGLDSINKDLKSQVRVNVDKVFDQINQQEDNENDKTSVKANTQKSTKPKNKRKREESESSKEMSEESCDEKKNNKQKETKRSKIENSDESDSSDVNENKISHDKSIGEKLVKKQKEINHKERNEVLNMLIEDGEDEEKRQNVDEARSSDEARSRDESEDEVVLIKGDKTSENKKKMKGKNKTKNPKDIKDSKGKQGNSTTESDQEMSQEKSKASSGKKKQKENNKASKNVGLSEDDDSLGALKNKLQKFEYSVENRDESEPKERTTRKLSKKEVEDAAGSSEDDFVESFAEGQKRKESKEMVKNDTDDDSDENLMALKSKLKTFENSVDTKEVKESNSESDERSLKKPSPKSFDDSGKKKRRPVSDDDSSDDDRVIIEKKKRGSNSSGKEDQKSNRNEDDSSKLKGLKRYLLKCGMRLTYVKFFDDCRSMRAKERKLEKHIKDITGIEGRITLKKCKKYKLKKERADELAELDVSKIIGTPAKGKRVTRQSSSSSVAKKAFTPPAGKEVFNSLRDLVDSEESESEKRARKTKKMILLDSDEDSDGNEENKESNSSDVENEGKKLDDISSEEKDEGSMDGNKQIEHDSEMKDSCEEGSSDSE